MIQKPVSTDTLILFLGAAALLPALAYALFLGWMGRALRGPRPISPGQCPPISVVVPLRNEELHVQQLVACLRTQEYPSPLEFVLVDDRSTDATRQLCTSLASEDPRIRVLWVSPDALPVASPKKRALETGIRAARHEVVATTDGDCRPPRDWLLSLGRAFGPEVGIVQGTKHIEGDDRPSHRYQRLEVHSLVGAEAAGFAGGSPFLASAPSLAWRRELWERSGGFDGLEELISGDDDMVVHRMAALPGTVVREATNPAASVGTDPVDGWVPLLLQRARWSSNVLHYQNRRYVVLLALVYSSWLWLLAGVVPAAFGWVPWWSWGGAWLLKIGSDLWFLTGIGRRLGRAIPWRDYVVFLPVQIFVGILAPILGRLRLWSWKK